MQVLGQLVMEVVVLNVSPNECAVSEFAEGEEPSPAHPTKVVGRRSAQKLVFAHLVDGGICLTTKLKIDGRTGTIMRLWTTKEEEEKQDE